MKKDFAELKNLSSSAYIAISVAALGYFVDIFDLLLFGVVRVDSLTSLGVTETQLMEVGIKLINLQMLGLLTGGVIWGILGDKRGRLSVLFGSIFLYSFANLANAFVTNVDQYAILRFIAGVGLAGELGAGITLVAEILPKHLRGYGTSFVAGVGILGAVFAGLLGGMFSWRICYGIGGGLGLLILLLRVGVRESVIFNRVRETSVSRGNFLSLFTSRKNFTKYFSIICVGIPLWYVVGILVTFSPEFASTFGALEKVSAGKAIMFNYLGLSIGDFASGFLSQWAKSRKKVILLYNFLAISTVALFMGIHLLLPETANVMYLMCALMGFSCGYWALFVTVAAEQFGTNIRATVTTSVPNFVRGSLAPMTLLFRWGIPQFGLVGSGILVGVLVFTIALIALTFLEETFHKDMEYVENYANTI